MNQKQKILLGLLVTLAIALAYRLTNPFEQGTVDRLTYTRATKVVAAKDADASPHQAEVRLDLLRSPPQKTVSIQRDPFRPPSVPKPAGEDKPAPQAPKPRSKSEREKIEEDFRRFKTFGSYQHGEDFYLFLERGKQVLVVSRGDLIDGKYKITEVAEKSATISAKGLSAPLKINFDEL
jgi:Tfp pilus assembly protein PilP